MGIGPSVLAQRFLKYLKSVRDKGQTGPIPWQTIEAQAAKSRIRLVRDTQVALANELKSLGYPIHQTKNHEFYYGEEEMFEGRLDQKTQVLVDVFGLEFGAWR